MILDSLNSFEDIETPEEADRLVRENIGLVKEGIQGVLQGYGEGELVCNSEFNAGKYERFFGDYVDYVDENPGHNDKVLALLTSLETNDNALEFVLNLNDRYGRLIWSQSELDVLFSRELGVSCQYFVLKLAFHISMHLLPKKDEDLIVNMAFNQPLQPDVATFHNRNQFRESDCLHSDLSKSILQQFAQLYSREVANDLSFYTLDLDDEKASQYQAHGALSRLRPDDALKKMLIVLQGPNVDLRQLYTCPLGASAEQKSAYGALGAMRPFPDSDF
ncbi:hypothetical protein HOH51_00665, partial [bacterium]|nr:hypothetical protein [bacterium]